MKLSTQHPALQSLDYDCSGKAFGHRQKTPVSSLEANCVNTDQDGEYACAAIWLMSNDIRDRIAQRTPAAFGNRCVLMKGDGSAAFLLYFKPKALYWLARIGGAFCVCQHFFFKRKGPAFWPPADEPAA